VEHERCARLGIVGDGAPPQAVGYSNDLARLVTVGEGRGRMVTWSGRLAKAKVAGSNPVFRSIQGLGFLANFEMAEAALFSIWTPVGPRVR